MYGNFSDAVKNVSLQFQEIILEFWLVVPNLFYWVTQIINGPTQ